MRLACLVELADQARVVAESLGVGAAYLDPV